MKTLQMGDRDLVLSNHNFAVLNDRDTLKQRIENRLSLYLGEFSLEPNIGMDWFSLRSRYPDGRISDAVRAELLKDSEIKEIISLSVILIDTEEKARLYNKPIRTALIGYDVNTVYGSVSGNA